MKTMFLLSHTPIPRFLKRIDIANEVSKTKLLYWDRRLKNDVKFTLNKEVECESIKLKAPSGKTFLRSLLLLIYIFKSLKVIRKYKPDNLHVGNFDMLLIAYIYKVLFRRHVRIIYEIGDLPEIVFKNNIITMIYKNLERVLILKVNYLILTSPYFWEVYYKHITEREKYIFIPNVPSKKIIKNISLRYSDIKSNKEKITIGFIGSVRYEKQLMMLIDVVKDLEKVNLIISGAGTSLEILKNYAYDYKNVQFTGAYDYKEIGTLYRRVDLVYSVYDTSRDNVKVALPNRLYESILFEKPIIAAKETELAKFVLEHNIGYQVSDKSPDDLRVLLIRILENKDRLTVKQKNCQEIKDNYTYETYIPKIKAIYRQ